MDKKAKIFIAGRYGMVGSAIEKSLRLEGYENIIGERSAKVDLSIQSQAERFFGMERPEYVFVASAKVGGIHANSTYPADFIYSNLEIQNNIIHSAYLYQVKKLLFLGSACIYPKVCPQPIKEEYLLSASLEPSNMPYAIAKIAGLTMCESYNRQYGTDFICGMPTNAYGPKDNYHPLNSHVLPALIRKFHNAKIGEDKYVTCWGTGKPTREFIYSDDIGSACVQLMNMYTGNDIINIGTGVEISIADLAELVKRTVGFKGSIEWDTSKPDGTPRRVLDCGRIHDMGWRHKFDLDIGLGLAYNDFLNKK